MPYFDAMQQASAYRRRKPTNYGDTGALQTEQGNQFDTAAGYADTANDAYLNAANNFDASKSINTYAQGAFSSISDALKKQIAATHGAAVGAGRFDSGFVDADTNDVYAAATKQLNDSIAQQAVAGAGLQLRNTEGLSQFGQNQQQTANDLLASQREFTENAKREEEERKRKKRSGIGGAIGGVLGGVGGFLLSGGNPMAAYAGYKGGSAIGSSF